MLISPMPSPPASTKSAPSPNQPTQNPSKPIDALLLNKSAESSGLPQFLKKRVAFREATHSESLRGLVKIDASTSSYTSYTSSNQKKRKADESGSETSQSATISKRDKKYGFTPPTTDLFPRSRLIPFLRWKKVRPVGPGLTNLGNTCFLNSVLQCLFYCAPLTEFLLAREHSKRCHIPKEEFCGLCAFEQLLQRVFPAQQSAIRPLEIVGRIKAIGKQFRPGRQEDAHEFLRCLLENFQKASLPANCSSLDHRSRESSVLHRIFGGYLQSTVKCGSCGHCSRTFEPFLDLSLDVKSVASVFEALRLFTAPETLSKSNRYRCEACQKLTEARKQFTVYSAPQILTIQLKRFSVNPMTGQPGKLNRPVSFDSQLDLAACMSDTEHGQSTQYRLCGVIVHEGSTCQSGHYHAFIRSPADVWYSMNDCSVSRVGLDAVLRQRAYILFYERVEKVEKVEIEIEAEVKKSTCIPTQPIEKKSRQERLQEAISLGRVEVQKKEVQKKEKVTSSNEKSNENSIEKSNEKKGTSSVDSVEDVPQLIESNLRASSMWHVHPTPSADGINRRAKELLANGWKVEVKK